MIVSEEEAKTKRCQESFGDNNVGGGFLESRMLPPTTVFTGSAGYAVASSPTTCLGSACMAWRWSTTEEALEAGFSEDEVDRDLQGYCGKAGKP